MIMVAVLSVCLVGLAGLVFILYKENKRLWKLYEDEASNHIQSIKDHKETITSHMRVLKENSNAYNKLYDLCVETCKLNDKLYRENAELTEKLNEGN